MKRAASMFFFWRSWAGDRPCPRGQSRRLRRGEAGPYRLSIVIRPPLVIPGVADVEVRAETAGVDRLTITPVPLTGEASKHPPVADVMERPTRTRSFTADTYGSWRPARGRFGSRSAAAGTRRTLHSPARHRDRDPQDAAGPRAAVAALGVLLVVGMIGIVGAATREAKLPPGAPVPTGGRRRGYIAMSAPLRPWWQPCSWETCGGKRRRPTTRRTFINPST